MAKSRTSKPRVAPAVFNASTTFTDLLTALRSERAELGKVNAAQKRFDGRRNTVAQMIFDLSQTTEDLDWEEVKEVFGKTQSERAAAVSTSRLKAAYAKCQKLPEAAYNAVKEGQGWHKLIKLGDKPSDAQSLKKRILDLAVKIGLEATANMLSVAAALGDAEQAQDALESLTERKAA